MQKQKNRPGVPVGNQNGIGHGRPSNFGFSNEVLLALKEELIASMELVDEEDRGVVHLITLFLSHGIEAGSMETIVLMKSE